MKEHPVDKSMRLEMAKGVKYNQAGKNIAKKLSHAKHEALEKKKK